MEARLLTGAAEEQRIPTKSGLTQHQGQGNAEDGVEFFKYGDMRVVVGGRWSETEAEGKDGRQWLWPDELLDLWVEAVLSELFRAHITAP